MLKIIEITFSLFRYLLHYLVITTTNVSQIIKFIEKIKHIYTDFATKYVSFLFKMNRK